jgi:hypothetical protein
LFLAKEGGYYQKYGVNATMVFGVHPAGIAMIVGVALLVDLLPGAAGTRAFFEVTYLSILLGATGGFLVYNINPASIFMGDSGSLLLGFSFAVRLSFTRRPHAVPAGTARSLRRSGRRSAHPA